MGDYIDKCVDLRSVQDWVAPPAHSLVARRYVHKSPKIYLKRCFRTEKDLHKCMFSKNLNEFSHVESLHPAYVCNYVDIMICDY